MQCSAVQCSLFCSTQCFTLIYSVEYTILYRTVQSKVQCIIAQCSAAHNALRCSTQCVTVQYSTVQYSTVQPVAVQSSPLFQGERWSTDERSHLDRQSPLSVRIGTAYVTHESVNSYDLKLFIASVIYSL